jgi:hypothetical protein
MLPEPRPESGGRSRRKGKRKVAAAVSPVPVVTTTVVGIPLGTDPSEPCYCVCHRPSFGEMVRWAAALGRRAGLPCSAGAQLLCWAGARCEPGCQVAGSPRLLAARPGHKRRAPARCPPETACTAGARLPPLPPPPQVGCDSDDCPIEWFHYECMGLTEAPKGQWLCPACRPELWKDKPGLASATRA